MHHHRYCVCRRDDPWIDHDGGEMISSCVPRRPYAVCDVSSFDPWIGVYDDASFYPSYDDCVHAISTCWSYHHGCGFYFDCSSDRGDDDDGCCCFSSCASCDVGVCLSNRRRYYHVSESVNGSRIERISSY